MTEPHPLLHWLDQHPASHIWLAGGTILAALGLAIIPLWRRPSEEKGRSDWIWTVIILGVLAAGRWPSFFVAREFNPDESRQLAGAHALVHDPVFWRSVDGATVGPLSYFALWPAGGLTGWDTYLAPRLTALLLLTLALTLLHQGLALGYGRTAARIASLSALCFEALPNSLDLLTYSAELLPMALMAAAFYAAARRWLRNGSPLWGFAGGLWLGAVPLAKMQATPLAGIIGLCWLVAELRTTGADAVRRRLYLLGGALLPAGLFASQLTIAGLWPDFLFSYFAANLHYVSVGEASLAKLLKAVYEKSVEEDSLLHLWVAGTLVWSALMVRFRPHTPRAATTGILAGLAAWLITLLLIISPGRNFLHYWHFLVLPATFLLTALIANLLATAAPARGRYDRWLVAVCAAALVEVLVVQRMTNPNPFMGVLAFFRDNPRTELSRHVARHSRPGEAIAIWGWSSYVYVEAGLWPAAREADFFSCVVANPYQASYQERFLADLARQRPPLFLDSSGPCSLIFKSPRLAHDNFFPALGDFIRTHYVLVDEFSGARIYQRRDLTRGAPP